MEGVEREQRSRRSALEQDVRGLVAFVTERERSSGTNRVCSYGIGADGVILLQIPAGYDDRVAAIRDRHGDTFSIRMNEWAVLVDWADGGFEDARRAADLALAERGFDPDAVDPDDIRVEVGGYRGKGQTPAPYCRVLIREQVLSEGDK